MAVGSNVVSKEMANVIEIREIIRFEACGARRRAVLFQTRKERPTIKLVCTVEFQCCQSLH